MSNVNERRIVLSASSASGPSSVRPSGEIAMPSKPLEEIEAVLPIGRDRLAIVNDTNFGSTGRNPALPDYSDFIRVKVPAIARR